MPADQVESLRAQIAADEPDAAERTPLGTVRLSPEETAALTGQAALRPAQAQTRDEDRTALGTVRLSPEETAKLTAQATPAYRPAMETVPLPPEESAALIQQTIPPDRTGPNDTAKLPPDTKERLIERTRARIDDEMSSLGGYQAPISRTLVSAKEGLEAHALSRTGPARELDISLALAPTLDEPQGLHPSAAVHALGALDASWDPGFASDPPPPATPAPPPPPALDAWRQGEVDPRAAANPAVAAQVPHANYPPPVPNVAADAWAARPDNPHAVPNPAAFNPAASPANAPYVPRLGGDAATRPSPKSPRWLIPAVAAVCFTTVLVIGVAVYVFRGDRADATPEQASTASATPSAPAASATSQAPADPAPPAIPASVEPAPTASPAPTADPNTTSSSPPAPAAAAGGIDAEAREALSKLRDGITTCARDTIGVLPGTSPAVPPSISYFRRGPYTSIPRDWSTPVWACSKFRWEQPQRFLLQWQSVKPAVEGMGIAWIDEDADGKADRALAFRATLKEKGKPPELSEIEPLSPMLPIAPPPR